jgi:two-component system nitrate/nitrite response regulator NarL
MSVISPDVALIHPARLFSDGIASIFHDTIYNLVFQATTFDTSAIEKLRLPEGIVFLVGGQTTVEILETIKSIRQHLDSAHILVICGPSGPDQIMLALEAGADGYLRDNITSKTLLMAIELLLQGETVWPAGFVKTLATFFRTAQTAPPVVDQRKSPADLASLDMRSSGCGLSAKEKLILRSLVRGAPNKVIAQRLGIAEATVKVHLNAILRKIGVKNRTQAAIWAVKYLSGCDQARGDGGGLRPHCQEVGDARLCPPFHRILAQGHVGRG